MDSMNDMIVQGYNIYANERQRQDTLKENAIMRSREDTAIQRKMADLKAAGLHPTLAIGQGGASAAAGQIGAPHPIQKSSGGFDQALMGAQLDNIHAQTAQTNADTQRILQDTNSRRYADTLGHANAVLSRDEYNLRRDIFNASTPGIQYDNLNSWMDLHNKELEAAAAKLGIKEHELRNKLLKFEVDYMEQHGDLYPKPSTNPLAPLYDLFDRFSGSPQFHEAMESIEDIMVPILNIQMQGFDPPANISNKRLRNTWNRNMRSRY